jgi:ankyrin repeat protein
MNIEIYFSKYFWLCYDSILLKKYVDEDKVSECLIMMRDYDETFNLDSCSEQTFFHRMLNTPWNKIKEDTILEYMKHTNCYNMTDLGSKKETLLTHACRNGWNYVANKLLETPDKCMLNVTDINGDTALMTACWKNMSNITLKILVNITDCKLDNISTNINTAFILAANNNMEDVLLKMLEKPELCRLDHIYNNNSMLMMVINKCKTSKVALKMLQHIELCNLSYTNSKKETAFTIAFLKDMEDVMLKLLDYPELTVESLNKLVLFDLCKYNFHETVLKLLDTPTLCSYKHFNKTTPLILSCKNGWTDVALKILDQYEDAEVDYVDVVDNNTALMIACFSNMKEVALKILEQPDKCNIRHANKYGISAYQFAQQNNNKDLMKKIFDYLNSESVIKIKNNKKKNEKLIKVYRNHS